MPPDELLDGLRGSAVRRDATTQPRDPQPWVTLLGLILFAAVVVLLMLIG
jgi:hypothetical protein